MAEEEQGEQKASAPAPSGSGLLVKVQFIIFCILLFTLLMGGIAAVSIIDSVFRLGPLNSGSGGGSGGGSLDEICPGTPAGYSKYYKMVSEEATSQNVNAALIAAIIHKESGWNQDAVSPAGAIGLMQLMPETAAKLGVNPYDARDNIKGGTKYIKSLLDRFKTLDLALAAYNAGPGAVEQYNGIPPYPETQNYVKNVLSYYEIYKKCLTSSTFLPGDMHENIKKLIQKAEEMGKTWKQLGSTDCLIADRNLIKLTFTNPGQEISMDQPPDCDIMQPPTEQDLITTSNLLQQGSIPIWYINGTNSGGHWIIIVDIDSNKNIHYLDPAIGYGPQTQKFDAITTLNNGNIVPYFGRSKQYPSDACLRGVYYSPKE